MMKNLQSKARRIRIEISFVERDSPWIICCPQLALVWPNSNKSAHWSEIYLELGSEGMNRLVESDWVCDGSNEDVGSYLKGMLTYKVKEGIVLTSRLPIVFIPFVFFSDHTKSGESSHGWLTFGSAFSPSTIRFNSYLRFIFFCSFSQIRSTTLLFSRQWLQHLRLFLLHFDSVHLSSSMFFTVVPFVITIIFNILRFQFSRTVQPPISSFGGSDLTPPNSVHQLQSPVKATVRRPLSLFRSTTIEGS